LATKEAEHFVGMPTLTYRTNKGTTANWLSKDAEKHFRAVWDTAYQAHMQNTLPEGPIVVPTRHPSEKPGKPGKLIKGINPTNEKKIQQLNNMAAKTYRERHSNAMRD